MPQDGEIDFSTYSREALRDAVRDIDTRRYPLNHQALMQELAIRSDREAALDAESGATIEGLPIRFEYDPALKGWLDGKPNSLKLTGEGEATVDARALRLHARQRGWFASKQFDVHEFLLAELRNVECAGEGIRFAYAMAGDGRPAGTMTFYCRLPREAEQLFARLPQTRVAELDPHLGGEITFNRALATTTPHVVATPALIAINVLVFLLMAATGAGFFTPNPPAYVNWGSNFGPMTLDGEWHRLLTSTFLHFGIVHLLGNMYFLRSAGSLVERLFGWKRFLLIYVVAGIAGSMMSTGWNPFRNSAGASGAIFGVYGALAAFLLTQRGEIPISILKRLRMSTGLFVAFSLASGAVVAVVDNAAHVGGLLAGFLVAAALARPIPRGPGQSRRRAAVATLLAVAVGFPAVGTGLQILYAPKSSLFEFERLLLGLQKEEVLSIERFEEAAGLAKEHRLTDAQFVSVLERDILPIWIETAARLSAMPTPATDVDRKRFEFIRALCINRRDAFQMMRDGLKAGDLKKIEAANALLLEGTELIEETQKAWATK